MKNKKLKKHKHYWFYSHAIIGGKKPTEVRTVRYCDCGKRQMAIISRWSSARGDYKLDEHYDL